MKQRLHFRIIMTIVGVLSLALPGHATAPQSASRVVIVASKAVAVSGERVTLSALVMDSGGGVRPAAGVAWSSSDPSVASVAPDGVTSTRVLGVATVHAVADGVRSQDLLLQVVPSRIDLSAPRSRISVGDELQLTARPLDIDGRQLDATGIQWDLFFGDGNGGDGNLTPLASINNAGVLKAFALGLATIRAFIRYPAAANGPAVFDSYLQISITPRGEYRLSRLAATDAVSRSFQLRPNYIGGFGVNDSGQIAFVACLDGLASALMLYTDGRFDVLASAGTPAFVPGNFIYDFENPSINNKGQVLTRVYAPVARFGGGLMLAARNGATMIRLEGSSGPGVREMNTFKTTRYSLNDRGEVLFLSNYTDDDRRERTGLFKQAGTELTHLYSSGDSLSPFLPDGQINADFFGLDRTGTAYFLASARGETSLYSTDGQQAIHKIVSVGDGLQGSPIVALWGVTLSQEGTLAMGVRLANETQLVLRYSSLTKRITTVPVSTLGQIHTINDSGDVLFQADAGSGWGLMRLRGDAATTLMSFGTSQFNNGQIVMAVRDAAITSGGELFTVASSTENDYVVSRGGEPRTLFQSGQRIDSRVHLNFLGFIGGSHAGATQFVAGGANASVFQAGVTGPEPVWLAGDRAWPGVSSGPLTGAVRSPSGNLYLMTPPGIVRLASGRPDPVLRFPAFASTGAETLTVYGGASWYNGANFLAANDDGKLAWLAITATGLRLVVSEGETITSIMTLNGAEATPAPSGGFFVALWPSQGLQPSIAIDDGGRVLVNAVVAGGSSGLFIYENGRWRAAGLLNDLSTQIEERRISAIWAFRSAGRKFYSILAVSDGNMVIAEYADRAWNPVVRLFEILPDGLNLNGFSPSFDVNRRGDIAFVALANAMSIVVRTADGRSRLVTSTSSPTPDGDIFGFQRFDLDLRDDGRLYFIGLDYLDRNVLYSAEPLG